MATSTDSLVSSSNSISSISRTVSSMKRGLNSASNAAKSLKQTFIKKIKVKSELITRSKLLTDRRREASKRRELEDQIEASTINPLTSLGISKIVSRSTRGFFGRVLDFLGYLTIGWLLNNLPTWISMGKEFILRLKKAGTIISGFVNNLFSITGYFGRVISYYASNLLSLDFGDSTGKVKTSLDDLYTVMDSMGTQLEEGYKLLATPLSQGTESGENAPPTGSEAPNTLYPETQVSTTPPRSEGGGGGGTVSPQAVYSYLKQLGVPETHALGILANIKGESGFRVGVTEEGGSKSGVGLFQYSEATRKAGFLRAVPDYKTNWKGQVYYAIKNDPNTPLYLRRQFSSPEEAAENWMRQWENPDSSVYTDRRKLHNAFIKSFKPGQSQSTGNPLTSNQSSQGNQLSQPTQKMTGFSVERPDGRKVRNYGELSSHHSYQSTSDGREVRDFTVFKGNQYINAPVPSPVSGTIAWTGYTSDGGNWVEIISGSGKVELGHFNSISVKRGQQVSIGTILGLQGATGRATGPHVHIQAASSVIRNYIAMLTAGNFSSPGAQGQGEISGPGSTSASSITPTSYPEQINAIMPETPDIVLAGGDRMRGSTPSGGAAPYGGATISPSTSESKMLNNFIKNKLLLDLAYL